MYWLKDINKKYVQQSKLSSYWKKMAAQDNLIILYMVTHTQMRI